MKPSVMYNEFSSLSWVIVVCVLFTPDMIHQALTTCKRNTLLLTTNSFPFL